MNFQSPEPTTESTSTATTTTTTSGSGGGEPDCEPGEIYYVPHEDCDKVT